MNLRQLCEELESSTRYRLMRINDDIRFIRKVKHEKSELIKLKNRRRVADQLLSKVRILLKSKEIDGIKYSLLRREYLESTIS